VFGVPSDVARSSGLPIKMLHDRILVALRREDGERRSTGGILIPATAQVAKRLVWGEARGVGSSVRQVKVGDPGTRAHGHTARTVRDPGRGGRSRRSSR
jgi:hypothetical protein